MAANPPSSPSSSPRLPSPPPMAEDQTAPQSPGLRASDSGITSSQSAPTEEAASRRIRPGTRAADIAEGPPLVEIAEIDSAFQLTEHLKALYYSNTHPSHLPTSTFPITPPIAFLLSTPPSSIERALWLYELCRFLVQKVNLVVTSLFADQPACSASTCPEMRASEWQYLCAVHDPPKACCAIDYCCHTLDWAANVLTNPKHFPSRLALGTENTAPQHQVRQLTNVFRRVYRIFAHAWFSHREMFWRVEGQTGLYVFFKTVCDEYNLLPEDGYTIPSEAESMEPPQLNPGQAAPDAEAHQAAAPPPSILKRPPPPVQTDTENRVPPLLAVSTPHSSTPNNPNQLPPPINTTNAATAGANVGAATARRHRHNPSTGASPVETVMEENEEEDTISQPATPADQDSKPLDSHRDAPPPPLQLPPQSITLPQLSYSKNSVFSPFSQDPNPTPTPRSDMPLFPQVPSTSSSSSSTTASSSSEGTTTGDAPPASEDTDSASDPQPNPSSGTGTGTDARVIVSGKYTPAPLPTAEILSSLLSAEDPESTAATDTKSGTGSPSVAALGDERKTGDGEEGVEGAQMEVKVREGEEEAGEETVVGNKREGFSEAERAAVLARAEEETIEEAAEAAMAAEGAGGAKV